MTTSIALSFGDFASDPMDPCSPCYINSLSRLSPLFRTTTPARSQTCPSPPLRHSSETYQHPHKYSQFTRVSLTMADETPLPLPDLQTILANLRALQGNGGGGEAVSGASATSETPAASHDPRLAPRAPPPPPQRPTIDPATITVWPEALRCINKISAQNAEFSASIRSVRVLSFLIK